MRTILPEAVCIAWNVGVVMPRGKLKGGHTTYQATSSHQVTTGLDILKNMFPIFRHGGS